MIDREVTPDLLREFLSYDADTGALTWRPRSRSRFKSDAQHKAWHTKYEGKEALTCINGNGYRSGIVWRKPCLAHRVIWAIVYGEWPSHDIDHINHNRLDNRIANLRAVTRAENTRNRRRPSNNKSGRVGVDWNERLGKWCAVGSVKGRTTHLGTFATFNEACARRAQFERERGYHENHGLLEAA